MRGPISLAVPLTPMVKRLMQILAGVYLVEAMLYTWLPPETFQSLAGMLFLDHSEVLGSYRIWTIATYAWFHEYRPAPILGIAACGAMAYGLYRLYLSEWGRREFFMVIVLAFFATNVLSLMGLGAPLHMLGNVVVLYFFGHTFEEKWGARRFLTFWVVCTMGGGLASTIGWYVAPTIAGEVVIGASAGAMGLIAAFAVYFPEQPIMYGFIIPIKGKHLLILALLFDSIGLFFPNGVAVFAHLGGVIAGLLLTTGYWRPSKVLGKFQGRKPKKPHLRIIKDDDDPPRYLH